MSEPRRILPCKAGPLANGEAAAMLSARSTRAWKRSSPIRTCGTNPSSSASAMAGAGRNDRVRAQSTNVRNGVVTASTAGACAQCRTTDSPWFLYFERYPGQYVDVDNLEVLDDELADVWRGSSGSALR